ncbi:MAG: flavodoxin family protein [Sphaerochaetaceae bacterium]|jgi:NAD(P)H dehydrogenase (quinone)
MARCSIIVHSVNGNSYIIAEAFQELLKERGVDARLYRVEDTDLHIWANESDTANDFYEEIQALPIASVSTLQKSKMVIMGCPTSFGNISAEMKAFMDATYPLAESRELAGRYFACFTSCSYSIAEGAFTIDSMVHYAQMMGLIHIPLGLRGANQPVSGIVHLAGKGNTIRPSQQLGDVMASYADTLAMYLKEVTQPVS